MWTRDVAYHLALAFLCCWFLPVTHSGRIVEYTTDGTLKMKMMNDYGIPVMGYNKILFEVKACRSAFFALSRTSGFTAKKGKYFFVLFGQGKKNDVNGIKDSCITCNTFTAHAIKPTINCTSFNPFFITWDGKGTINVGEGMDETNTSNIFLKYKTKDPFPINFLSIMSQKANATWRFRVDLEPRFTAPESHGATVLQVSEETPINKEIYTLKAWDPEDDNLTFTLGDTHRDVFKIDGTSLMLLKPLDFEQLGFYSLQLKVSDGFNTVPCAMVIQVTRNTPENSNAFSGAGSCVPDGGSGEGAAGGTNGAASGYGGGSAGLGGRNGAFPLISICFVLVITFPLLL